MAKDFYLTLPSNVGMEIYVDKATSHFTTPLHHIIDFPCEFEAAETELHYPSFFPAPLFVSPGINEILVRDVDRHIYFSGSSKPPITEKQQPLIKKQREKADSISFNHWDRSLGRPSDSVKYRAHVIFEILTEPQKEAAAAKTFEDIIVEFKGAITPGYYTKIEVLLEQINNQLNEIAKSETYRNEFRLETPAKLSLAPDGSGRITVSRNEWQERTTFRKTMYFSGALCLLLGFSLGADILNYDVSEKPHKVALETTEQIFVYGDFIVPQLVGDVSAPLIRTLHARQSDLPWGMASHIFTSPYYLPVNKRSMDTVEINLRDQTGQFIPFAAGTSTVVVHFRPAIVKTARSS